MTRHRMARTFGVLAIVILLAGPHSPGGDSQVAPARQQAFGGEDWGLTLRYPTGWERVDRDDAAILGWYLSFRAYGFLVVARDPAWADPDAAFETVLQTLLDRIESGAIEDLDLEDLTPRDVGGTEARGVSISARAQDSGIEVAGYLWVFARGGMGYAILGSAPRDVWSLVHERECDEAFDILLTGEVEPATPTVRPRTPTVAPTRRAERPAPTLTPSPTRRTGRPPGRGTPTPATPDGDIVFRDDFAGDGGYLSTYHAGDGDGEYVDGVYRTSVYEADSYIFGATVPSETGAGPLTRVGEGDLQDVTVDVDVRLTAGPRGSSFGVACGFANELATYALLVSGDGRRYVISRFRMAAEDPWGGEGLPTGDFRLAGQDGGPPHPAIRTGEGETNHLQAVCARTGLALYANGEKLAEYRLDEELSGGVGLLAVSPGAAGGPEADFDNLVVRRLAGQPEFAAEEPGRLVAADDFSDPETGWLEDDREEDGEEAHYTYEDGAYHFSARLSSDDRLWWSPAPGIALRDQSVEIDVTQLGGDQRASAALICRASDDGEYQFLINPKGQYAIGKVTGGRWKALMDWKDHRALKKGQMRTNRIRADLIGDRLTLYVNGTKVREVRDAEFGGGYVRLAVGSGEDRLATYAFDNFTVRAP